MGLISRVSSRTYRRLCRSARARPCVSVYLCCCARQDMSLRAILTALERESDDESLEEERDILASTDTERRLTKSSLTTSSSDSEEEEKKAKKKAKKSSKNNKSPSAAPQAGGLLGNAPIDLDNYSNKPPIDLEN